CQAIKRRRIRYHSASGGGGPSSREKRHDLLLRLAAGDVDHAGLVHEDVDLAADAELGQVDAGLDRETGARQDAAILVRLQVVHVGAVAVRLLADGVAGAVDEIFPVAGLVDHLAGGLVHLPALQYHAVLKTLADAVDGGVTGRGHDVEDARVLLRDLP